MYVWELTIGFGPIFILFNVEIILFYFGSSFNVLAVKQSSLDVFT